MKKIELKRIILFIFIIIGAYIFFRYILTWFGNPIFATVFSGVLVFVLQKLFSDLVLEPYLNYKKVVGEIDNKLKFYANIMYNKGLPDKMIIEAMDTLRKLSCDLESSYKMMVIKIGPSAKDIVKASGLLIFLSNNTGMNNQDFFHENLERALKSEEEIRKILKIEKYG